MKTALITGCNRGLGLKLLEVLAADGFCLITLNRKPNEEFDRHMSHLERRYGIFAKKYYADFLDVASLNSTLNQIEETDSNIDVLVNNAGINNSTKPIFNTDYSDVEACFRVNYFAPFLITKKVVGMMVHNDIQGSIINISSTVSIHIDMAESCYGASKAALNLFTQSVAQELAPFGIRMNALACGVMNTDMFNSFDDKVKKKATKRIGFKRPADLDEIAQMVSFLASEKSSYVTGAIIPVDGGFV